MSQEESPVLDGRTIWFLIFAALLVAGGAIALSLHFLFFLEFESVHAAFGNQYHAMFGLASFLMGLFCGLYAYTRMPYLGNRDLEIHSTSWNQFQRFQFGVHLCFLGYTLLLMGVCSLIIVMGLLKHNQLDISGKLQGLEFVQVFKEYESYLKGHAELRQSQANQGSLNASQGLKQKQSVREQQLMPRLEKAKYEIRVLLILSCVLSVFGAMFFTSNTLREKRAAAMPEMFDRWRFWGELVFRSGEAVLFTFVFFWLIWNFQALNYFTWLPVISLFMGMFIKSGEQVIYGLSDKVLQKARLLIPSDFDQKEQNAKKEAGVAAPLMAPPDKEKDPVPYVEGLPWTPEREVEASAIGEKGEPAQNPQAPISMAK